MFRYAILLFLLLTVPSRANLGESIADCVKRYGRPVSFTEANDKTPFGTLTFIAGSYALVVFVAHDKEVGARVTKTDKSAFTDAEMKTIMDADSNTTPWTSVSGTDPSCLQWSRADKAKVVYDKDKRMLIFTSDDMDKVLNAKP